MKSAQDTFLSNALKLLCEFGDRLNGDTGMVLLSGKPPEGEYMFNVAVYDQVFDKSHTSEVRVIVKGIPAEAVYSSGSVRLDG